MSKKKLQELANTLNTDYSNDMSNMDDTINLCVFVSKKLGIELTIKQASYVFALLV